MSEPGVGPLLWLAVALGGGLGAAARVLIAQCWLPALPGQWPHGTLIVNLSGSLLIGLLCGWMLALDGGLSSTFLLLGYGVLGGFTTVSSLSLECLMLFRAGRGRLMVLYLFASVSGGLLLAAVGLLVAAWLMGSG